MKSLELRKSVAPLVLVSALGFNACGGAAIDESKPEPTATTEACLNPKPLEAAYIAEGQKAHEVYFTNGGPCVAVYDRETMQTLGTIATDESFFVACYDEKPNSIDIVAENVSGAVNLGNGIAESQMVTDYFGTPNGVPAC